MINVNALTPQVRLQVSRALRERLNELDEDSYEQFLAAARFAEAAIAERLASASDIPTFFVAFGNMELVVAFSRSRERFVIRDFYMPDDEPPPGGASAPIKETYAESLLRALNADVAPSPTSLEVRADEGFTAPAIDPRWLIVGDQRALWREARLLAAQGLDDGLSGSFMIITASAKEVAAQAAPSLGGSASGPATGASAITSTEVVFVVYPGIATPGNPSDP